MATNADMSLKEFAKEMLVEVKKDQEWLTRQKEIMGDLQERMMSASRECRSAT